MTLKVRDDFVSVAGVSQGLRLRSTGTDRQGHSLLDYFFIGCKEKKKINIYCHVAGTDLRRNLLLDYFSHWKRRAKSKSKQTMASRKITFVEILFFFSLETRREKKE